MISIEKELYEMNVNFRIDGPSADIGQLGLAGYGPEENYCTFISSEKYLHEMNKNVVAVITTSEIAEQLVAMGKMVIVVENPAVVFFRLHNCLTNIAFEKDENKIIETAVISKSALISSHNVVIGENSIIEDDVKVYDNTHIGNNVIVRAGSVIGGQEFEYKRDGDEVFHVNHVGHTIINDGVEIGYNSIVGRAIYPWDKTEVGKQTKMADNVVIGHGAKIGKCNLIGAGTVICGRCNVGDDVWIGPNCSISNALTVGSESHIGIGSVVINNILEGKSVFGNPARTMPGI